MFSQELITVKHKRSNLVGIICLTLQIVSVSTIKSNKFASEPVHIEQAQKLNKRGGYMTKKKTQSYSYSQSLEMLNKLQGMAIEESNINLALKAEELKCKIASLMAENQDKDTETLTKILVDFINDKQSGENI